MTSYTTFLLIYTAGGITFIPLVIAIILLHAYLTLPTHPSPKSNIKDHLRRQGDDEAIFKSGTENIGRHDWPKESADQSQETASGCFAVCREFVPGGVNGKPPERTTPAGEKVSNEDPSTLQKLYGAVFERKKATPHGETGAQKQPKRAKNVFYVVLRHRHLMLYDDSEQTEVRHVVSLDHHRVDVYSGEDSRIPEGELWIRRNAIRLSRRVNKKVSAPDGVPSKPFYLFSENCSEKEDFYFALLRNQENNPEDGFEAPRPLGFEIEHAIGLVQRLHSVDEHAATRWLNALVGRLFLSMYQTDNLQEYIRNKIKKKISRVNKPAFLSEIRLQRVHMGSGAPQLTNIKLKEFNVDGSCAVETDVHYSGGFRVEIATVAKIDLGTRFKTREVDLVLAIKLKKLDGKVIFRFKPPPSNRVWMTFEKMPNMDLSIEPIVSSRQLTYTIITGAIESRIKEVLAETLVLPHWDDIPYVNTIDQDVRGGIWAQEQKLGTASNPPPTEKIQDPSEAPKPPGDFTDSPASSDTEPVMDMNDKEKTMSMPSLIPSNSPIRHRKAHSTSTTSDGRATPPSPTNPRPHSMRAPSFHSAAAPIVTDTMAVSPDRPQSPPGTRNATESIQAIASRPRRPSPQPSPPSSPHLTATFPRSVKEPVLMPGYKSRRKSADAQILSPPDDDDAAATSSQPNLSHPARAQTGIPAEAAKPREIPLSGRREPRKKPEPQKEDGSGDSPPSTIKAAAGAAKQWGWNVINKRIQKPSKGAGSHLQTATGLGTPEQPMGKGIPLPPIGEPLPKPAELEKKGSGGGLSIETEDGRKGLAGSLGRGGVSPSRVSPSRIPTKKGSTVSMGKAASLAPMLPPRRSAEGRRSMEASESGSEAVVVGGEKESEKASSKDSESPTLVELEDEGQDGEGVSGSGDLRGIHLPARPSEIP